MASQLTCECDVKAERAIAYSILTNRGASADAVLSLWDYVRHEVRRRHGVAEGRHDQVRRKTPVLLLPRANQATEASYCSLIICPGLLHMYIWKRGHFLLNGDVANLLGSLGNLLVRAFDFLHTFQMLQPLLDQWILVDRQTSELVLANPRLKV